MSELEEVIREEIRASGPMGFDVFMRMALYDVRGGYYARERNVVGREGDFYTSVGVGEVFGRLMLEQVSEVWERMGEPERFMVVEQGANDGQLAEDLLGAARERDAGLAGAIEYVIVEPVAKLQGVQEARLGGKWGKKVRWSRSLGALERFEGVFLCNECVDAFPFKRVRREGGEWRELRVGLGEEGEFRWESKPVDGEEVAKESALLEREFPEGYETEIRPVVADWVEELGGRLERGVALIVDYGLAEGEYFDRERKGGTLRCYRGHRAGEDPLVAVGEQDISAHVNFSRLAREAAARGFAVEGFADQHHFLVDAGREMLLGLEGEADAKFSRQFQTLTHPGLMGRAFKVLGLSRGLGREGGVLTGFRHGEQID